MTIICIGDILTEGDYGVFGKSGIANIHAENYPYFLSKILAAEVRNFGKCGYRSSTMLSYYENGNVDLNGADVIIVMLGTNGGQDSVNDSYENECYRKLIAHLKKDAPDSKLILCTPPHATVNPEFSNCGYMPQIEEAVKFVRKYAEESRLPLIDVALCPDFTAENEKIYQANDGLHFVEEGYRVLAQYIANGLKGILNN